MEASLSEEESLEAGRMKASESENIEIGVEKLQVKIKRVRVLQLLCSVSVLVVANAALSGSMEAPEWQRTLRDELVQLGKEAQELTGSFCPRIENPSALEFLRDFVLPNRPCIITGAMEEWPARRQWSNEYLTGRLGEKKVSVNVTPDGRGDAIVDDKFFVLPEERLMTFAQFLAELYREGNDDVLYLSHQNDNLRSQIGEALLNDVPPSIPFVDDALGHGPDAVNLWMGDSRSVTTLHKDHYENLYAVIRGEKIFTLYPPTSLPFLYPHPYGIRRYRKEGGAWRICELGEQEGEEVKSWISVNPNAPDYDRHPLFEFASKTQVRVRPGEMLYLPSMWFHQVEQSDDTVAVNYWYDMVYGDRYAYHKFIESMVRQAHIK
ncbi:hypothetical protein GUITHDRAFT_104417 [Guillardia theta CCMP2712]|uniref:JmjC domain-containing protein n=1 Tax=Guillardia theta (strain CCMP2712) TaxID=905079 RepID=L1JNZ9_GUITC|nr:hypothetical protein GUITHDRAFT_104417 [Guillardia theta CCMP2712]EKX50019.1 hypothetical protein GUITHDRAFT_104417 [Guillardia theta CCMP2712]|eukprot:XP_005836999.1 hypothetical protein GUITHDRAFT_104417 [Guillardia theta CCMP2712]